MYLWCVGQDDLEKVLAILRQDDDFRTRLEGDPAAALAGFDLDDDELRHIEEVLHGRDGIGFDAAVPLANYFAPDEHGGPDQEGSGATDA